MLIFKKKLCQLIHMFDKSVVLQMFNKFCRCRAPPPRALHIIVPSQCHRPLTNAIYWAFHIKKTNATGNPGAGKKDVNIIYVVLVIFRPDCT